MKIYNEDWEEIENPDLDKGRLVQAERFIQHHEAVEYNPGVFREEIIAEYPETGGKDVVIVYEVEPTEAKEPWDEYEKCFKYVEYTEEELLEIEANKQANEKMQQQAEQDREFLDSAPYQLEMITLVIAEMIGS